MKAPIKTKGPFGGSGIPEPVKPAPAPTADRIALLYSDGSISVLKPGTEMEAAERQRRDDDRNETNLANLTRIAVVEVKVIRQVVVAKKIMDKLDDTCPTCGAPHTE